MTARSQAWRPPSRAADRRPPRLRGTRGLPLLILALTASPPAAAAVPRCATNDAWVLARTEHFAVFSNSGGRAASQVALQLERFREVMFGTIPALRPAVPWPTDVIAFRDEACFRDYRPAWAAQTAGWFQPGIDRGTIGIDLKPEQEDATDVLFQEFTHGTLRGMLPRFPLWLDVGFAEYAGATRIGNRAAEVGGDQARLSTWLRSHRSMPIADLFALTPESPEYVDAGLTRSTFRAESWLLTRHLLRSTKENARRFELYLIRLEAGEEPDQAFERIVPREQWNLLLAEALRGNQGPQASVTYAFQNAIDTRSVRVDTPGRAEVLYRLGSLALHGGETRPVLAEEHFHAALEEDSTHAASEAALGYIADLRGDSAAAEGHYRRASSMAGRDPRPWLLAGLGTLRRFLIENPGPVAVRDSTPPLLLAARLRFARALELDPGNPEALAGFGRSHTCELEPAPRAIEALERAVSALPARTDVLTDLVVLRANAGGHLAADSLLRDALAPRLTATQLRVMEAMVLQGDFRLAERLSARGETAQAESLFARVAGRAGDPGLRRAASQRLRAREQNPAQDDDAAIDLYNQGVAFQNQGRYPQALEWFRRARAMAEGDSLRSDADRRIAEIRGRLLIDEGVALFDQDRLTEARSKLRSALALPLDDQAKAYATRFIRRIDELLEVER